VVESARLFMDGALRSAHPRGKGRPPIFAMFDLEAYSDASGGHGDGKFADRFIVVAGYFGEFEAMRTAEDGWRAVLLKYLSHVPEDEREFHAKVFWARDEQGKRTYPYNDWDDAKANDYINDLIDVIGGSAIHPASCSIFTPKWKTLSLDERRQLTGAGWYKGKFRDTGAPTKPYFSPFRLFIWTCAKYCAPGQLINFFFDIDSKHSGYSLRYFTRLRKLGRYKDRLGQIDFPDSVRAPIIQCADLLAYEIYHYEHLKIEYNTPKPPLGNIFPYLVRNMVDEGDMKTLDAKSIDIALNTVPVEIRTSPTEPISIDDDDTEERDRLELVRKFHESNRTIAERVSGNAR
jgi:hypothetical protein